MDVGRWYSMAWSCLEIQHLVALSGHGVMHLPHMEWKGMSPAGRWRPRCFLHGQGPQGDVLLDDASDHRRGEWVARELVKELDHLLLCARGEEPRQVARDGWKGVREHGKPDVVLGLPHWDEPDWQGDRGHGRS